MVAFSVRTYTGRIAGLGRVFRSLHKSRRFLPSVLIVFGLVVPLRSACGAIESYGDVLPGHPWLSETASSSAMAYVGNTAAGTLTIDDGSTLSSTEVYVGYNKTASGSFVVDDGTWKNGANIHVGYYGSGTLSILNGGTVSVTGNTYVGEQAGSAGLIDFGTDGGTLTTSSLFASPSQLSGAGTIKTSGIVSDMDLVFDSTHAASQTLSLEQNGQTTNIVLTQSSSGCLGAGWKDSGSLTIRDGLNVRSCGGYLGYCAGASGVATVSGSNSAWYVSGSNDFCVGYYGSGTLSILNGGTVTTSNDPKTAYIGYANGATGLVSVDGTGSCWKLSNTSSVFVGYNGAGTLSITNGGSVSVTNNQGSVYVGWGATSSGLVDFGVNGGTLTTYSLFVSPSQLAGSGTIKTNGIVSDMDLVFDSTHAPSQTLSLEQNGQTTNIILSQNNYGHLGAGWKGTGSLTIQGRSITSSNGYLGYNAGAAGLATISGTNSGWSVKGSDGLYVGYNGAGTLSLVNGGRASVTNATYVGWGSAASGLISFGLGGGSLTTASLFASPTQLTGSGTITTNGLVSDIDLVFDSTHSTTRTLSIPVSTGTVSINLTQSSSGCLGAGWNGAGSLTIEDKLAVSSSTGYLGYHAGATGVATVSGSGSSWSTGSAGLYVGYGGDGTLAITDRGAVSGSYGNAYLGYENTATGSVSISGTGSTWSIDKGRLAIGYRGSGTLSITSGGSVSSGTSTSGYYYAAGIACMPGSTGAVYVDGVGSIWRQSGGLLCVGGIVANFPNYYNDGITSSFGGSATLSITNGGSIISSDTIIGEGSHSVAKATVDGTGSTWSAGMLVVGLNGGSATLSITNGGSVSSSSAYVGYHSDIDFKIASGETVSAGMVTVNGKGSMWWAGDDLVIGYWNGSGILSVKNGGGVRANSVDLGVNYGGGTLSVNGGGSTVAQSLSINDASLLAVDVGRGSSISLSSGAGTITNDGIVRILAGAGVPFDGVQHSPIAAGTWSGTAGIYQAVGGQWDATNHLFTASSVSRAASGSHVALDLGSVQRALVTSDRGDGTTWTVGASFVAAASTTNITFTATAADDAMCDALEMAVGSDRTIFGAWTFSTTDYDVTSTNPIYLSLLVGPGYSADGLTLWHYDGANWSAYSPMDLTYDGTYASFTATGLSGYAVATPEPGVLTLLATALLGILVCNRHKKRR
jgi:T5SS/PEP-CTERM-associated repeat protein